jgi:simple sugar transport system permease protein
MIRMATRAECSRRRVFLTHLAAVLLALAVASVFMLVIGQNPLAVYASMIKGAFGNGYRVTETIRKAIPLVITSVGIAIAFKLRFWNIGAEGQIAMGAFGAAFVALKLPGLPAPVLLPLMALAGVLCGGVWGLIPAFFRAKFRTNETIFTLMLNYIALKWITYLQYGPWRDPGALGFPKIPNFSDSAVLPKLFGIHLGWLAAVLLVVWLHVFLNHTKIGYEISVAGESENTARYAGMSVFRIILLSVFLSGGICGLCGMIEASAINRTLSMEITRGVGYTAIITAWLSGLNAAALLPVCLLFAGMQQGGNYIQMAHGIPESAARVLQSLILFAVLGSEFFIRYRLIFERGAESGGEE